MNPGCRVQDQLHTSEPTAPYVKACKINLWTCWAIRESNPGSFLRAASGLTTGPPRLLRYYIQPAAINSLEGCLRMRGMFTIRQTVGRTDRQEERRSWCAWTILTDSKTDSRRLRNREMVGRAPIDHVWLIIIGVSWWSLPVIQYLWQICLSWYSQTVNP